MQPASASAVQVYGAIDSIEMHNNVFYKVGGGGVSVMRSDSGGSYGQSGANNWVASGSSNVPSVWTGTITGTDPGFVNVTGNDLRLTSSSALLNRGVTTTVSPSGHSFPSPLALPLYHPPMRRLEVAGTALARTIVGSGPDLGAYEYGTAVSTPTTGTGGTGGTTGSTGGTGGTTGSTGGTGGTTTSTTCLTASASTTWQAIPFAAKTGTFTAEADVTPLAGDIDGGVALSNGATSSWKNLASIVLFHPTGKIFARNGGAYTAGSIGYSANVTYHIRLVVDMAANTYSAYVRPAGGTEQTIGTGLAFRTEQTDVPQLSSMTLPLDQGSMRICNPTVR